jgi:hypothetical protein
MTFPIKRRKTNLGHQITLRMDIFTLSSSSLYLINPYFFVQLDIIDTPQVRFVVTKNYSWKFEGGKLIREEKIDDDQIFFDLHLEELGVLTHSSQPVICLDEENEGGMDDCLIVGRVTEITKRGQIRCLLKEHLRPSSWKDLILNLLS